MKYLIILLPAIVLLSSCDDVLIKNGVGHVSGTPSLCTTSSGICAPGLLNKDIGDKAYGYVEMDFSLNSPLSTASSNIVGILLRFQSGTPIKYYSCQISAQPVGNGITAATSNIQASILGANGPTVFANPAVISNRLTSTVIGDHTLGCEIVLVGANRTVNLYLDGALLSSYVLGSNPDDTGPLTTGTGKVGFMAVDPDPSTDNIKILDLRYYDAKP